MNSDNLPILQLYQYRHNNQSLLCPIWWDHHPSTNKDKEKLKLAGRSLHNTRTSAKNYCSYTTFPQAKSRTASPFFAYSWISTLFICWMQMAIRLYYRNFVSIGLHYIITNRVFGKQDIKWFYKFQKVPNYSVSSGEW